MIAHGSVTRRTFEEQKPWLRRLLEPLILGTIANVLVNYLFNPDLTNLVFDEFVVACCLALFITELNRFVDQQLEKRSDWTENPRRRFVLHLILISLNLLIAINILGYGYMWVTSQGYFSVNEMVIINLVVLGLSLLLTITNWAVYFYSNWKNAEAMALIASRANEALRLEIEKQHRRIRLQKGTTIVELESGMLQIAKIESGTVRLYTASGYHGVFPGTLSELYSKLPDYLFFPVTRNAVLHRELIAGVSSISFGKIQLTTKENFSGEQTFIISRPKAATFRKWYNSTST